MIVSSGDMAAALIGSCVLAFTLLAVIGRWLSYRSQRELDKITGGKQAQAERVADRALYDLLKDEDPAFLDWLGIEAPNAGNATLPSEPGRIIEVAGRRVDWVNEQALLDHAEHQRLLSRVNDMASAAYPYPDSPAQALGYLAQRRRGEQGAFMDLGLYAERERELQRQARQENLSSWDRALAAQIERERDPLLILREANPPRYTPPH